MAGMLPGVELARRRRTSYQHHFVSPYRHLLESASSSQGYFLQTSMDETAIKARSRLEEKLRGFSSSAAAPSGRARKQPSTKEEKAIDPATYKKESHTTTTLKRGKQPLQLDRVSSQRDVCSICLEDFLKHQQVTNLRCCHKYHSNCLRPWLVTHSHCPYCRTNVNSSD